MALNIVYSKNSYKAHAPRPIEEPAATQAPRQETPAADEPVTETTDATEEPLKKKTSKTKAE